jgi:hypothetical protein
MVSLLIVCGLLALCSLFAYGAAAKINSMVASARIEAVSARDAYWQGEIAKSNALARQAQAEQREASSLADAAAQAQIDALNRTLTQMETDNAALPNAGACGLDGARVRLLPN